MSAICLKKVLPKVLPEFRNLLVRIIPDEIYIANEKPVLAKFCLSVV